MFNFFSSRNQLSPVMYSFELHINYGKESCSVLPNLYLFRALQWALWYFQKTDTRETVTRITIKNRADPKIEFVLENEQEVRNTARKLQIELIELSES